MNDTKQARNGVVKTLKIDRDNASLFDNLWKNEIIKIKDIKWVESEYVDYVELTVEQ